MVLEYVAEALEVRPVREEAKQGEGKRKANSASVNYTAVLDDHTRLFKEMKEANEEFNAKLPDNFNSYIELVDKTKAIDDSNAPVKEVIEKRVCSAYSGLIHDMDMTMAKETPHLWKTVCGWPYGFSNFT